jgi:hypothetical protein
MIRPGSNGTWAYFWIKDMEQVRFSLQRMGFRDDDVEYWYQCYFARRELSVWQQLLRGAIRLRGIRRALKMALKQRVQAAQLGSGERSDWQQQRAA